MENIEALTEIMQRNQPTLAKVRRQCLYLDGLSASSSEATAWRCLAEICSAVDQYANAPDDGEDFDWTPFYCELDGYSGSSQHRVDHSHACATESLDLRRTMWPASFSILEDALELYILNVASYVQEY